MSARRPPVSTMPVHRTPAPYIGSKPEEPSMEGGNPFLAAWFLSNPRRRITQIKQMATGEISQLSPRNEAIIKSHGDTKIVGIVLKRTPVTKAITKALSVASGGKFGRRMNKHFDELFHLFMELTLSNGKRITLEKNERITLTVNAPKRPNTEEMRVSGSPKGLTLARIMEATKQYMGTRKFYLYSAKNNNCQDFLLAVCLANRIGAGPEYDFIKQDTKQLFKNLPFLRKLSNTVTSLGARVKVLTEGGGPVPSTSRAGGSGARRALLREFNRHLETAKKVVGHGTTTNNHELEKGLRKLGLTPMAVGTVCDPKKATYMIANESCKPPGTHWVAYYKGARYDPLGKDKSGSAEQNNSETNCGQRCIAYLLMCRAHKGYVNL